MLRTKTSWIATIPLSLLFAPLLWGQQPCTDQHLVIPQPPTMIEADLNILRGQPGQKKLPEWSKIEKLRDFFRTYAAAKAPCTIIEGEEYALRMFVDRTWLDSEGPDQIAGRFVPGAPFQFYGASRLKVERADAAVTRRFAFPIDGAAEIGNVIEKEELDVLIEDLAQLQLVKVPRLVLVQGTDSEDQPTDCFVVSNVTAIPSRVFDESGPAVISDSLEVRLTLNGRRRALEHVVREAEWLQRVDSEAPGCRTEDREGFLGRQVTSLNLTMTELIPQMDFMAQSIRFWREVDQRVERLRAEEENWKKELLGNE